jgi:hypothetical protein
MVLANV